MGMRPNSGDFQSKWIMGPGARLSKRDDLKIRIVYHVKAQTGPREELHVTYFHYELRHFTEAEGDGSLKFRMYEFGSPEPRRRGYKALHWAGINAKMKKDGRFFDDYEGKTSYYDVQLNPFMRLQQQIFMGIEDGRIAPDRVVMRAPNPSAWNTLEEVERALARENDPRVIIDPNKYEQVKDWSDRQWSERVAGVTCGIDPDLEKKNMYTKGMLLAPKPFMVAVAVADNRCGLVGLTNSTWKSLLAECNREMERLQDDENVSQSDAEDRTDVQSARTPVQIKFKGKTKDPETGRERKSRGSEFYVVLPKWGAKVTPEEEVLITGPYDDLETSLMPTAKNCRDAYEAVKVQVQLARATDIIDVDDAFKPWLEATKDEDASEAKPTERSTPSSGRVEEVSSRRSTAASSKTSSSTRRAPSFPGAKQKPLLDKPKPKQEGLDTTMGGRFREVPVLELIPCNVPEEHRGAVADSYPDAGPEGRGCESLMLHPDWHHCPFDGIVWNDESDVEPPTPAELFEVKWPAKHKCMLCRAQIPHDMKKCWQCGAEQPNDDDNLGDGEEVDGVNF